MTTILKLDQNTVCPLAACPQCSQCLRYKNYLQIRNKEASMTVVNTELVTPTSEGCPYLLVKKCQRIAYCSVVQALAAVPASTAAGMGKRSSD